MSHFITTHNSANESIFSTASTEQRAVHEIHGVRVEPVYTFQTFPPNLSSEDDIKRFDRDRESLQSFGNSKLTAVIVSFPPSTETAMHRTPTVNIGVVLEGTVKLHLDTGEERTLNKGDSYTQRGTMHKWRNPSQEWSRVATFTIPIAEPFELDGKKLTQEP